MAPRQELAPLMMRRRSRLYPSRQGGDDGGGGVLPISLSLDEEKFLSIWRPAGEVLGQEQFEVQERARHVDAEAAGIVNKLLQH